MLSKSMHKHCNKNGNSKNALYAWYIYGQGVGSSLSYYVITFVYYPLLLKYIGATLFS